MKQAKPIPLSGFWGLGFGILCSDIGVCLMRHGDLGLTTFYAVPMALAQITGKLTMGAWNWIVQILLIALLALILRSFHSRFVFSFLVAAVASGGMDAANALVSALPDSDPWRLGCFASGFLIMATGVSVLAECGLPVMPLNLFVRDLANHLGLPFAKVKLWFDLTFLAIAVFLGLVFAGRLIGIGFGTLASAVMGPLTGVIIRWLRKRVRFVNPIRL